MGPRSLAGGEGERLGESVEAAPLGQKEDSSQGSQEDWQYGGHPTTFQNILCILKDGGVHPTGQT